MSAFGPDRLVLLGTKGGPALRGVHAMPSSNLLVKNGRAYVIDAGYGATYRLAESGISLPDLSRIFITHHHSDHNLDLGPMLMTAWTAGLRDPVVVHAPAGIDELLAGYWQSNRFDIETRIADEGLPDLRDLVSAEVYGEGLVFADDQVRVTALRTIHPPVTETFALKFSFTDKTLVFSADTAPLPALAGFAENADILLHEVMYGPGLDALVRRNPNAARLIEHLRASHTLAEDVGAIATQARAKLLVLNHFVPGDDRSITPAMWEAAVRTQYNGPILVGHDLLSIPL
jgi:ribonuclease BN (tRNA processing enzyme)